MDHYAVDFCSQDKLMWPASTSWNDSTQYDFAKQCVFAWLKFTHATRTSGKMSKQCVYRQLAEFDARTCWRSFQLEAGMDDHKKAPVLICDCKHPPTMIADDRGKTTAVIGFFVCEKNKPPSCEGQLACRRARNHLGKTLTLILSRDSI